jgi:two-component system LytT family response regulator
MKTIIIDDEQNARLALRGILEENFPEIDIVDECKDIPEAVKAIHKYRPALLFLDISMPGYSGLELFSFFDDNEIDFKVIFVTAHSEYAVNAFELSAVDYILKPIRIQDLERAINKLASSSIKSLYALKHNFDPTKSKKLALQTGEGIQFLDFSDIIYLKADGSYTHFITKSFSKITVSKKIGDFERLEVMAPFLRIHRSSIVNLEHISKILKQDGGSVIMENGDQLSISTEKRKQLLDYFKNNSL